MLVHGASGAVGLVAVQIGHAAGLTVIGTAGTEGRRPRSRAGRSACPTIESRGYLDRIGSDYQQRAMS